MPRFTERVPDPRVPDPPVPDKKADKLKVVIVGGGVAGLTVAYELNLTGRFDVEVIERRPAAGGKARTLWEDARFHEHSMRALLGSYVCLFQILSEVESGGEPLIKRLRPAIMTLQHGSNVHEFAAGYTSWFWVFQYLRDQTKLIRFLHRSGVGGRDLVVVIYKLLRFLSIKSWQTTSEINRLSFEDYVSNERRSLGYEKVVFPIAEIFVAAKAYSAAGVVGRSLLEWFVSPLLKGRYTRRGFSEFDGPTSEAFIEPLVEWLKRQGVKFHFETTTTKIDIHAGQVDSIHVEHEGASREVHADAYVLAVQHNVAHALLPDDAVGRYIPGLANFPALGDEWAHSIQFVVDAKDPEVVAIGRKFVGVIDSPWSIAYRVYSATTMRPGVWEKGLLPPDKAVLTATMSNCRRSGIVHGLPFLRCTRDEIVEEVIAQTRLKSCLGPDQATLGLDIDVLDRNEIDDTEFEGFAVASVGQQNLAFRTEAQMYIRLPGNVDIEPENGTGLYNLFLAGEYTRTRYTIPTMEKSCESGKRCSHAVLSAFGLPKDRERVPDFALPFAFLRTEFFGLMLHIGGGIALIAGAGLAVARRCGIAGRGHR